MYMTELEIDADIGRFSPTGERSLVEAEALIADAIAACRDLGVPRLLLGGGVAANARVRSLAAGRTAAAGIELRVPPLSLCTDNGAMIASLGAQLVAAGHEPSGLGFGADSTLPVTQVQI